MTIDDALKLDPMDEATGLLAAEVRRQETELKEYKAMLYHAAIDFDKERAEVRRLREENETGKNMYAQLWDNAIKANKEVICLRERERVLVEALGELVSIVKIHSNNTDNDFAWAEMQQARAALEAAKE